MSDELIRMTATEAVARLRKGEISPLELVDASEARIAEVEPAVNALPTLCFDRARDHAKRLMKTRYPLEIHNTMIGRGPPQLRENLPHPSSVSIAGKGWLKVWLPLLTASV